MPAAAFASRGTHRFKARSKPMESMSQAPRPRAWRAILVRSVGYFLLWMIMAGGQLADIVPTFGSINMIGGECDR